MFKQRDLSKFVININLIKDHFGVYFGSTLYDLIMDKMWLNLGRRAVLVREGDKHVVMIYYYR